MSGNVSESVRCCSWCPAVQRLSTLPTPSWRRLVRAIHLFSQRRAVRMLRGRRKWLGGVCDWLPAAATQDSSDAAGTALIGAGGRRSPQGRGRRHGCGLLASSRTASGIASWRTNGCCPRRRRRRYCGVAFRKTTSTSTISRRRSEQRLRL